MGVEKMKGRYLLDYLDENNLKIRKKFKKI